MTLTYFLTILTILVVTAAISILVAFVYKNTLNIYKATHRLWDDSLISAVYWPLQAMLWLWGLCLSFEIVFNFHLRPVREAGTVFLFAWFLYRYVINIESNYLLHIGRYNEKIDQTSVEAIGKILKIIILFFTAIFALKYFFNMSLTGLWTITGAGSIIIGFAAKDMLANFFGAMMIYFNRPFSVGDLTRSPDKDIEGYIEQIGWRATCIRTLEATTVYVPNSVFSTVSVENTSRRTHRRVYESVDIQYGDLNKLNDIASKINDMLMNHPQVDTTKLHFAQIWSMAESCIRLRICAYTQIIDSKEFEALKHDILVQVMHIIVQCGANLPSSIRTVLLINPKEV